MAAETERNTDIWLRRPIGRDELLTIVGKYRRQLSYMHHLDIDYDLVNRTFDDPDDDGELGDSIDTVGTRVQTIQRTFDRSDFIAAFRSVEGHRPPYDGRETGWTRASSGRSAGTLD